MTSKDAAFELFKIGWAQNHIGSALKVSEATLVKWKKAGNWEVKRTELALAKETSEELLWEMIAYQLKALKAKKDAWEKSGDLQLIDKGDVDALSKMYSSVKAKQHTWGQTVDLMTEFISFVETRDLAFAKKIIPLSDEFLTQKKASIDG